LVFMASMTGHCDDGGRCTSWLGTPIIEWRAGFWGPVFIPLGIGTAAGIAVWWLLGRIKALRPEAGE
jgi:hypothetical protein